MINEPVGGIILAGGQSRRMGTNKALLRPQTDGPTLLERALAALREVTPQVLLVTNQPEEYSWLDIPMVGDNYRVGASLAGLEAGLNASHYEYNLVVACDMPYIRPELLRYLVAYRREYDALVPVSTEGQAETLCAIYNRRCLPVIRRQLEQGIFKMAGWFSEVKAVYIPARELENYDPALSSFINLNTPEEFERFKKL
jgi:molybdopterin-guanine dinucleotide biosynthesis protein A